MIWCACVHNTPHRPIVKHKVQHSRQSMLVWQYATQHRLVARNGFVLKHRQSFIPDWCFHQTSVNRWNYAFQMLMQFHLYGYLEYMFMRVLQLPTFRIDVHLMQAIFSGYFSLWFIFKYAGKINGDAEHSCVNDFEVLSFHRLAHYRLIILRLVCVSMGLLSSPP